MRVLIACEFSGIVREAFRARGHIAYSCDLLPTEIPGPHYQESISNVLHFGPRHWDLLIFHWECTRLCNSGVRWLFGGRGKVRDEERWRKMELDARTFKSLLHCTKADRVCGENPIMHKYAAEIVGEKYSQIIQPWQFGHGETKATCLWLKNLPRLKPTNIVEGRTPRVHFASPGPDRWKERSRTLPGIAAAMAEQWG
jgi:hypothetical protein